MFKRSLDTWVALGKRAQMSCVLTVFTMPRNHKTRARRLRRMAGHRSRMPRAGDASGVPRVRRPTSRRVVRPSVRQRNRGDQRFVREQQRIIEPTEQHDRVRIQDSARVARLIDHNEPSMTRSRSTRSCSTSTSGRRRHRFSSVGAVRPRPVDLIAATQQCTALRRAEAHVQRVVGRLVHQQPRRRQVDAFATECQPVNSGVRD